MTNTDIVGYQVSPNETMIDVLKKRVQKYSDETLIERKVANAFIPITAIEFQKQVDKVAKGLIAIGVKQNDHIAICSQTSFEWLVLDFAILSVGGVTVPIYETNSKSQIDHILKDANIKIAFVQNTEIANRFDLQSFNSPPQQNQTYHLLYIIENNLIGELSKIGETVEDSLLENAKLSITSDNIASIVYTSGSTGKAKGVLLTHKAYVALCYNAGLALPTVLLAQGAKLLLFLPLAHGFARLVAYAMFASNKTILGLSSDIKNLLDDLKTFKPTVLLGVPRIFEKVYNAAQHKAGEGVKGVLFKQSVQNAVEWSKSLDQTRSYSLSQIRLMASKNVFDLLIYRKIREVLGNHVEYCVCGGAKLNQEIAHFFRGCGITILEGYGMTETVAPITVNRPDANKIGSIGLPFPGVCVKIADDGELLINSVSNFIGYNNLPDDTKQTLVDNISITNAKISGTTNNLSDKWIASGDLAQIDDDGFVYIIGRKKDILVTAGGKNISPAKMESLIDTYELVENSCIVAEGRPYVSVLITLDPEGLNNWKQRHGISDLSLEEAVDDAAIHASIQRIVDKANAQVSRAESIRKIKIITDRFTQDQGTLTPSLKIRRSQIYQKFNSVINEIYSK